MLKKSRIWETKHLSTDADGSTDTTVGWTKNTQNPKYFEKQKKLDGQTDGRTFRLIESIGPEGRCFEN